MFEILETGIKNSRNVLRYFFRPGAIKELETILSQRQRGQNKCAVYFVDQFFEKNAGSLGCFAQSEDDKVIFVDSQNEPTTDYVNLKVAKLLEEGISDPFAVIGIGGGTTLDIAKAVSNLLTNGGKAEDYQGWDLVKVPGVYKVGIPTISGTGAEATRTCVLTNKEKGLKLGMNSDHTVFDQLILDPDLTETVPSDQYFYTGMDAYIHCMEVLSGHYRNVVGDAFSDQAIKFCREVFLSDEIKSARNREKLMVASYFGGCAVGTTYVGVLHPFSAGLSVVLGMHHGIANCVAMTAMEEFYPRGLEEFWRMVEKQNIPVPRGVCRNLNEEQYDLLYEATIIHEKPLTNALGDDFKSILTKEKVIEIFRSM